jgi:hypothetical protein
MSIDKTNYYISPSGTYIINKADKKYLLVKKDRLTDVQGYMISNPETLVQVPGKKLDGYVAFRYSTKFRIQDPKLNGKIYNDCLRLGEELTCGIKNYIGDESILQEKYTGKTFGDSMEKNRQIAVELDQLSKRTRQSRRTTSTAQSVLINDDANPVPGETYAVVKTKKTKIGEHPFHISHVLFRDEDFNITLEANAAYLHLDYPNFYMYSTDPDSQNTFHKTWNFMYNDGVTMVLVSRGIRPNYERSKRISRRHSIAGPTKSRKSKKSRGSRKIRSI